MSTIIQGDTASFTHTIRDQYGNDMDLSGCTVWAYHKVNASDADADAVIKHTIAFDSDGDVSGTPVGLKLDTVASTGIVKQRLTATETAALPLGDLHWYVQVKSPGDWDDDDVTEVLSGTDTIVEGGIDAVE